MKIDTHGLKMIGLRKASGCTKHFPCGSGQYFQISYDTATGEVLTTFHLDNNSWTEYDDENIILICHTQHHLSIQTLADMIASKVSYNKRS